MYVPLQQSLLLPLSRLFTIQSLDIRQGKTAVADYTIEFRARVAENGWNPTVLMATFHQGLGEEFKDELVHQDTSASRDDPIDLVLRIDNRVRERHRARGPEISGVSHGAPCTLSLVHVPDKRGESRLQPMELGHARLSLKFIKNFSTVAAPLIVLTRKASGRFCWSTKAQQALEELKLHLIKAPILQLPDAELPFVIEVDVSEVGTGAVLCPV
ncbi:hypothetical protein P4O66_012983 [Electrophorus voltai]|uniref:Reverse transcriptase/retrotransposon-derived protein RNase H-like domain-containing protein n=1 Tax=Electrophorus voltai TaxID=2609070 RepID=A0AAD9E5N2_9TELE|nr:hypothetical protein P4O66_012983 [Electrophorus voltai]